jgi:hypothetical protein
LSRQRGALVLLLALAIALVGHPTLSEAGFSKGLLAGWNNSDWDHTAYYEDDFFQPKNGFCAGLFVGKNLSGVFGLRGEVLYTRKGAKNSQLATNEDAVNLGEVEFVFNVDYLEIPLLATFTFSTSSSVRPMFFLGPAVDFELSSSVDSKYTGGVDYPFQANDGMETLSSVDLSLIFGGGMDIDAGGKIINIQVRYVMGMKEIYYTAKNKTLSIMAGFEI